jgi:4-alpha-glucanotransferase
MRRRGSGILLHVTSLPSPHGIGDLGPGAYDFSDFLSRTRQSYWQVLPLTPTEPGLGNLPYSSTSAFAGNPILISPDLLVEDGLLTGDEASSSHGFHAGFVDYPAVMSHKNDLFTSAHERFKRDSNAFECDYQRFLSANSYWLDDYAVFAAFKWQAGGGVWSDWPEGIRDREPGALKEVEASLRDRIEREKFLQYIFSRQWARLKCHCNRRGIHIVGDAPFYVSFDSADVWAHPDLFKLDERKQPTCVAGVPPDYFSKTGQRWGNPIYKWDALREADYGWWIRRIEHNLSLFDWVRIDHFRGFEACWEVPAVEETAINGKWVETPGEEFFNALLKWVPYPRLIAEDLGIITPAVRELMGRFQLPGMRVLLFAFGGDVAKNSYAPHNHVRDCVVYTGTHDNNTVRGWFDSEATPEDRQRLSRYVGRTATENVHWDVIRLALMSVANVVIIPMQDILGLGSDARMNQPATAKGNWAWRLLPGQLGPDTAERLLDMVEIYGRR